MRTAPLPSWATRRREILRVHGTATTDTSHSAIAQGACDPSGDLAKVVAVVEDDPHSGIQRSRVPGQGRDRMTGFAATVACSRGCATKLAGGGGAGPRPRIWVLRCVRGGPGSPARCSALVGRKRLGDGVRPWSRRGRDRVGRGGTRRGGSPRC